MSKKQAKAEVYPYPSRFGSHKSMVIRDGSDYGEPDRVVCQDEYGEYNTFKSRLDTGVADPNRCYEGRLGKLFSRSQKEK